MIDWCDSINGLNQIVIIEKDIQLALKDRQINDQAIIIGLQDDKFKAAEGQIRKQSLMKNVFLGTAIAAVTVTVAVIIKNSIQ